MVLGLRCLQNTRRLTNPAFLFANAGGNKLYIALNTTQCHTNAHNIYSLDIFSPILTETETAREKG
jgi:hypothetical protein